MPSDSLFSSEGEDYDDNESEDKLFGGTGDGTDSDQSDTDSNGSDHDQPLGLQPRPTRRHSYPVALCSNPPKISRLTHLASVGVER